jgi:DNA modification methylase
LVLDPFSGSGSTCVAAKLFKRNYIGIEINQEYNEYAKKRLEEIENLNMEMLLYDSSRCFIPSCF